MEKGQKEHGGKERLSRRIQERLEVEDRILPSSGSGTDFLGRIVS